jgi:hypothetical protein
MTIQLTALVLAGDKQRLHCPYPNRAVLNPGQDRDKAVSYTCKSDRSE